MPDPFLDALQYALSGEAIGWALVFGIGLGLTAGATWGYLRR